MFLENAQARLTIQWWKPCHDNDCYGPRMQTQRQGKSCCLKDEGNDGGDEDEGSR